MSLIDQFIGIFILLLLLFFIFVICPFLVGISTYLNKKFMKIVRNKKLKYKAKRNKGGK